MFDLPEPFGPTMAVMPLANSKTERDAKVLYPCSSSDFKRRGIYYPSAVSAAYRRSECFDPREGVGSGSPLGRLLARAPARTKYPLTHGHLHLENLGMGRSAPADHAVAGR